MRSILFFFVLSVFVSTALRAQETGKTTPAIPLDPDTKLITYSRVVEVQGAKDSLYVKGKKWFYSFYKNPVGVIKQENPAEGFINGKHQFKILNPADKKGVQTMKGIVRYSINTKYKENKARIELTNINFESTSYTPVEKWLDISDPYYSEKNPYYLTQIDSFMNVVITDFAKRMQDISKAKKDSW